MRLLLVLAAFFFARPAHAYEVRAIPDEYEATTAADLALNNAGFAANDPHAAIRVNPALLAQGKNYSLEAGYHWPSWGREFYQATVVDSKTSPIAAGLSYTSFTDGYNPTESKNKTTFNEDSSVQRRGVIGFGNNFGNISGGIGATYVDAVKLGEANDDLHVKGLGLNIGLAAVLTPELRVGGSIENASNRKIADYAPKTIRAGAAYALAPTVTGYVDFRQRDRVVELEAPNCNLGQICPLTVDLRKHPEQMLLASFSAQVYDFFRLLGSYGQELGNDRKSLSGGIAVVNKGMSLAYTASRPYMKQPTAHQAVSFGLDMAL
jgi:hypothetical protein